MQGMLAPAVEEVVTGNAAVREVFKISKVGTVAGCYVTDGYLKKVHPVRLIRDGVVVYTGQVNQIKRLKDDEIMETILDGERSEVLSMILSYQGLARGI